MKKLFFLLLALCSMSLMAKPQFQQGKTYLIVSKIYLDGCVSIGSTHNVRTPVYYLENGGTSDDCYWYITEEQSGYYSIQNVATGQYVTYTGIRDGETNSAYDIRYVDMTNTFDEDDALKSFWTIDVTSGNYFTIRNASVPNHLWDVRVSPSFVVGTYSNSGNPSDNQCFAFYDEDGNLVENLSETVSGYDVSSWFMANTNVESSKWVRNSNSNSDSWLYHEGGNYYNGEASVASPFYEIWHWYGNGFLADNSISQTLYNLPAGNYTLQADMIAVLQGNIRVNGRQYYAGPASGVSLFAQDRSVEVSTGNESPIRYTVDFAVGTNGIATFGVQATNTTANWIALDNVVLYYHATESELINGELAKLRADALETCTPEEIEEQIYQTDMSFEELEALRKYLLLRPGFDPLSQCASDLTIKGRTPIYAESLGMYLCSISEKHFGTNFTDTIAYTLKAGYNDLRIDGTPVPSGSTYAFNNVTAGKTYTLSFSNGTETISRPLTFTALPVVRINGEFNNTYSRGYIVVAQPNKKNAEFLNMKAKWRGGITNSNGKHKRNYHVKLQDEYGNKIERKYFDLRKDNSWILESCQVDMSRIRNRVLTDLWNDYRRDPYYIDEEPEALSGTRGSFVELILNDEYRGIYCMTENMDRKQMKLKKYDEQTLDIHGMLWKSKDWSYGVFMGHYTDNNNYPGTSPSYYQGNSESWESYNVKYPDIDEVYPTDWSTLYNAVNFVCTASDDEFRAHAAEYFDLPVVIDYYILMETILSTDNHGKNMFFAVYDKQVDKKITLGVWDMDATCGQRWSDDYYHQSFLGPEQDYAQFITNYEHGDYNLFRRLRNTDADNFNMRVAKRYRELRQNKLATDSIINRFKAYFDKFKVAGADQREYNKWSYDSDVAYHELNFDTEYSYLADWFTRRMNYLDTTRFDIAHLPLNGDVNGDGQISIADVTATVNYIRGQKSDQFNEVFADVNGDGRVTFSDVNTIVNTLLGK